MVDKDLRSLERLQDPVRLKLLQRRLGQGVYIQEAPRPIQAFNSTELLINLPEDERHGNGDKEGTGFEYGYGAGYGYIYGDGFGGGWGLGEYGSGLGLELGFDWGYGCGGGYGSGIGSGIGYGDGGGCGGGKGGGLGSHSGESEHLYAEGLREKHGR